LNKTVFDNERMGAMYISFALHPCNNASNTFVAFV